MPEVGRKFRPMAPPRAVATGRRPLVATGSPGRVARRPAGCAARGPSFSLARVATEADVRKIALSLPETSEEPWYSAPGFKVKGRGFLRLRTEAEGGLVVFISGPDEKEMLLSSAPKKYFTTPHYKGGNTILVNLKAVGVRELRALITESWRLQAPPKLLAAYDRDHPSR